MNATKVFRWLTYSAAAAVIVTFGAVMLRPDSAKNAIKERFNGYLNVPETVAAISPVPSPVEGQAEVASPTPVANEQPGVEVTPEMQPTNEPAAPSIEQTPSPEPTAATTPEVTPEVTPEPTAASTVVPTPEPTAAATPTPNSETPPNTTPTPAPSTPAAPPATATPQSKPAGTYTVLAGDTYGCIAEKYYGSYEYWPMLVAANQGVGFEERRLFVGAVVQLPAVTVTKPLSSLCS